MTRTAGESSFYFYRGRVALCALLRALDLTAGGEVLVQAFTCLAVPIPIIGLGLRPIYVDITKSSYSIDPERLEARITERTKVIIVQHTFGIPAEMSSILAIARKHNLFVIEDCCHVLGSKDRGMNLGSIGDAAFYSYEWGKPIVVGLGGAAVANSAELAGKLRWSYINFTLPPLRDRWLLNLQYLAHRVLRRPALYWLLRDIFRRLSGAGLLIGNFGEEELSGGLNREYQWKMGPYQVSRLRRELRRANALMARARRVAQLYEEGLRQLGLPALRLPPGSEPVLLLYPVWAEDKAQVLREARRHRIDLRALFTSPIHPLTESQWKNVGYEKGSCPRAEAASRHVVSLPVNAGVRDVERSLQFLCDMLKRGLIRRSSESRPVASPKELAMARN